MFIYVSFVYTAVETWANEVKQQSQKSVVFHKRWTASDKFHKMLSKIKLKYAIYAVLAIVFIVKCLIFTKSPKFILKQPCGILQCTDNGALNLRKQCFHPYQTYILNFN